MPNDRVFDEVEAVTANGIALGGVTSLSVEQGYVNTIESNDGGQGPSQRDRGGQKIPVSITLTDVLQLIPLLIATPGTIEFYGHQSGASTYVKATVGTANSKLVMLNASLRFSMGAYAQMTMDGLIRSDGSETFETICVYADGQAAPTLAYPARLWKPTGLVIGSITVRHPVDLSLRIAADVRQDYGDGDVGISAVDIARRTVSVDLTVRDSGLQGVTAYEVMTELMRQGTEDLAFTAEGVGNQAGQTLTLRNCAFESRRKAGGRDWTGHTLSGGLQFKDPLTPFTPRTFDDATPADRIINFA